jgi:hypothetical protein
MIAMGFDFYVPESQLQCPISMTELLQYSPVLPRENHMQLLKTLGVLY